MTKLAGKQKQYLLYRLATRRALGDTRGGLEVGWRAAGMRSKGGVAGDTD